MSEPSEISKLLQLKRDELPPEGYFDTFLLEFQRRQRSELLHRSMWSIFWDRVGMIAPNFHVPQFAYAAVAVVAVAASGVIFLRPSAIPAGTTVASATTPMSLYSPPPVTITDSLPVRATGSLPAHYVLQTRPVSYEQPVSF